MVTRNPVCWSAVLGAFLWLVSPAAAAGQACRQDDPPCPPDLPPTIQIGFGNTAGSVVTATVYFNDDYALDALSISVSVTGGTIGGSSVVCASSSPYPQSCTGTYQIDVQPGSGTFTASIYDSMQQFAATSASYTYTPPPPPPPHAAPVLSLESYNGDNRDMTRCVASCFEQTLSYTTRAYVSLDVPRSIALVYSAATVVPEAIVMLDATDASVTPPDKMSFKLKRANQTLVPLEGVAGNATEVFFAQGANGTSRLGGRFSTGAATTSDSSYTAVVTSYWGSTFLESTIALRVPIVRETTSPYGAGWTIAGLQRIVVQSDGAVLTSGGGSIAFFGGCLTNGSTCASPPGDFTTLTRRIDGTGWDRRWLNGAIAAFDASGRLTSFADRYGNQRTYAYVGGGLQLASITDPAGKVTTLGYDGSGRLDYIRDPSGRETRVTVNAAGDLTEIYDPDGVLALQVGYDGQHMPQYQIDRMGGRWDFTRDFAGKLSQIQSPAVTAGGPLGR